VAVSLDQPSVEQHHVGKLGEKWQFPSDHLTVGAQVNRIRFISWNVLNNKYIPWVTENDSQGLNGSMITDLNHETGTKGLTERDKKVVSLIKTMFSSGDVITLQECGLPFLKHLNQNLPANWTMVRSSESERDQEVILYDTTKVVCVASQVFTNAYPSVPGRPLQVARFVTCEGEKFTVINPHIPGEPTLPARKEFATFVKAMHQPGTVTVALGDYNFERHEMLEAFEEAGVDKLVLHSPWPTNIDPGTKNSKCIDHIAVLGNALSRPLTPQEITQEGSLLPTINLLRGIL
jgi:hypothetical protein